MLAMDVVDTLRHERMLITRDIDSEVRRDTLVDRLRDIYRGQGIDVPDDILMDGVTALEEERFRYHPPRESLGTKLALLYINRGKWLPLFATLLAVIGLGWAVNHAAFERPAQVEQARIERLADALPAQLDTAYSSALDVAGAGEATRIVQSAFADGQAALQSGDFAAAEAALDTLRELRTDLALEYDLRIINRSGEMSGLIWDNVPYVVVEATGPDGAPVSLSIESATTGRVRDVSTFAVEVDRATFESVAADFEADRRVDASEVGSKARGELDAEYTLDIGPRRLNDAAKWRAR